MLAELETAGGLSRLTQYYHTPRMDPNGKQLTVHTDEGPGICPHGGKGATMYSDAGSFIDPNG